MGGGGRERKPLRAHGCKKKLPTFVYLFYFLADTKTGPTFVYLFLLSRRCKDFHVFFAAPAAENLFHVFFYAAPAAKKLVMCFSAHQRRKNKNKNKNKIQSWATSPPPWQFNIPTPPTNTPTLFQENPFHSLPSESGSTWK